jgi:hypothetical protein
MAYTTTLGVVDANLQTTVAVKKIKQCSKERSCFGGNYLRSSYRLQLSHMR